jgi:hypothetical protein
MPSKFVAPTWVSAWAAIGTVAQRLSIFSGGADDNAAAALSEAIVTGEIPARAQGFVLAKDQLRAMILDGMLPLRDLEIQRLGLEAWLTGHEPKPISGRSRGRTATFDWDAAWAAMCLHVHENGLPAKQADLERVMLDWFVATYDGQQPSVTMVKAKMKVLFDTFRKAGN